MKREHEPSRSPRALDAATEQEPQVHSDSSRGVSGHGEGKLRGSWAVASRQATKLVGPASLVIFWHLSSTQGLVNPVFLPAPGEVAERLWSDLQSGILLSHLWASLIRVGGGFGLACVIGIGLGLIMGMVEIVAKIVGPVVELMRPISPVAWIPLGILWFGLGNGTAWFVIFLAAFFPIVLNTYMGVKSVATNDLRAAACCGIQGWALAKKVILPSSLPDVMAGLRIGLGIAWMAVIAAELVAAQTGLGYLIERSRQVFDPTGVLVGMVIIGVVGLVVNNLIEAFERRMTRWRHAERASGSAYFIGRRK